MKSPLNTLKLQFLFFLGCIFFMTFNCFAQKKKNSKEFLNKQEIKQQLETVSEYYQNGQFDRSNQLTLRQLKILEKNKDATLQFQCYNFLAANYTRTFKDDSAIYAFEQANELLKIKPQLVNEVPEYVVAFWNNQGAFYRENTNYQKAYLCFSQSLKIQAKMKNSNYFLTIEHLANLFDFMGQYEKAHLLYNKIILDRIQDDFKRINLFSSMGWNQIGRKKYKNGHESFTKALNYYNHWLNSPKNEPDNTLLTKLYYQLSVSSTLTKHLSQSNYYLNKGITIQTQQNNKKGVYLAWCYEQKARNAAMLGNNQEALSSLQKGIISIIIGFEKDDIFKNPALSKTILGENTLFKLLAFKGQLLHKTYQQNHQLKYLQASAKTYQLAILLAENYRETIDNQEDKIMFTNRNSMVFDEALNVVYEWYVQNPNTEKATMFLSIVESRKSVAYNDFIKREQVRVPVKYALDKQKQLLLASQIAQLKQDILQKNGKIDTLETKLRELEKDFFSIKNKLNGILPTQGSNTINDLSIQEISAQLSPFTTFISYDLSSDNHLYILMIRRGSWLIKKRKISNISLLKTINQFLPKLQRNPALMVYTGTKDAILLYDLLVKPLEKALEGTNRLVVCRDGILNNIPFEVLEQGKEKNDFLLKKFAFTYTFSAIDYIQKQQVSINHQPKTLTIYPFLQNYTLPDGNVLKSLNLANRNTRKRDVLLGKQATKQMWLAKINQYNQLNLITHATTDMQESANAYLYFYPDSVTKAYQLGFYEIMALSLQQQQLVVIASCNSAKGALQQHEGSISLAYAFMRAGAGAVVGASWEAHNRAIGIITEKFESYLNAGLPKDVALQKAKLAFMEAKESKDLDHPFYWANLTLIGNNQALSIEQSPFVGYVLGLLALIGVVLFIKTNLPKKSATRV
ncbi:CHAT domain-containing tetratricopeptide repeat protein [Arcicella sp. LKC2W]|uniref:CHAT domain-containing protein n=1 Tax=Arcicella sp. LKC2W TaxID=2984198 RepID=UPI002B20D74C|nr:CHAT domain-containing tetratricopeptide repeat protein [Arcicella sp. LKC2W]MEA5461067.1 CHAT domain-containing tetratricopeptide repeat protein [Arcicella sp. LKC2W]